MLGRNPLQDRFIPPLPDPPPREHLISIFNPIAAIRARNHTTSLASIDRAYTHNIQNLESHLFYLNAYIDGIHPLLAQLQSGQPLSACPGLSTNPVYRYTLGSCGLIAPPEGIGFPETVISHARPTPDQLTNESETLALSVLEPILALYNSPYRWTLLTSTVEYRALFNEAYWAAVCGKPIGINGPRDARAVSPSATSPVIIVDLGWMTSVFAGSPAYWPMGYVSLAFSFSSSNTSRYTLQLIQRGVSNPTYGTPTGRDTNYRSGASAAIHPHHSGSICLGNNNALRDQYANTWNILAATTLVHTSLTHIESEGRYWSPSGSLTGPSRIISPPRTFFDHLSSSIGALNADLPDPDSRPSDYPDYLSQFRRLHEDSVPPAIVAGAGLAS
jgi:hypothetical protein